MGSAGRLGRSVGPKLGLGGPGGRSCRGFAGGRRSRLARRASPRTGRAEVLPPSDPALPGLPSCRPSSTRCLGQASVPPCDSPQTVAEYRRFRETSGPGHASSRGSRTMARHAGHPRTGPRSGVVPSRDEPSRGEAGRPAPAPTPPRSGHRASTVGSSASTTSEAAEPFSEHATFDAFFTRRLRDGARPVDSGEGILRGRPAMADLHSSGPVSADGLIEQVKGRTYSIEALLGSAEDAQRFPRGRHGDALPESGHVSPCPFPRQPARYELGATFRVGSSRQRDGSAPRRRPVREERTCRGLPRLRRGGAPWPSFSWGPPTSDG